MNFVERASIDRDSRFKNLASLSPAGTEKMLRSQGHAELLASIAAAGPAKVFVSRARGADCVAEVRSAKLAERITKHLALVAGRPGELQPQAVCDVDAKTFVPMFDDDFGNSALGVRLGLAKPGEQTLFSFFLLHSGELACVVDVNYNPHVDAFVAAHGKRFSFARICCAACGIATDGRLKCGACRGAVYCGRACQAGDWPTHRKMCCSA
jgi:hypothetical protein